MSLQLSTFGVNYVGHPFNSSIRENRGMYFCLFYGGVALAVLSFDVVPGLSELFGLVPIPAYIRSRLIVLCLGAFGFNFFLEHTMRALFPAPKPPAKGYMWHSKLLRQLGISEDTGKAKKD
jgi:cation-transporting ATPase 13A1